MITSTVLDILEAIAAQHHDREAARNAPKPVAIRAVYAFVSALAALEPEDWHDVRRVLVEELAAIDEQYGEHLDDWLAGD